MRLGEFHTIEVTFKGTLLLLLKRVQADLTLSPEVISYGCSPWVMHIRFFAPPPLPPALMTLQINQIFHYLA